jgi:hypothetical protein
VPRTNIKEFEEQEESIIGKIAIFLFQVTASIIFFIIFFLFVMFIAYILINVILWLAYNGLSGVWNIIKDIFSVIWNGV